MKINYVQSFKHKPIFKMSYAASFKHVCERNKKPQCVYNSQHIFAARVIFVLNERINQSRYFYFPVFFFSDQINTIEFLFKSTFSNETLDFKCTSYIFNCGGGFTIVSPKVNKIRNVSKKNMDTFLRVHLLAVLLVGRFFSKHLNF